MEDRVKQKLEAKLARAKGGHAKKLRRRLGLLEAPAEEVKAAPKAKKAPAKKKKATKKKAE
jgi:hypothetical protein